MVNSVDARVRFGVETRAAALSAQVTRALTEDRSVGAGIRLALELFEAYARAIPRELEQIWADTDNIALRANAGASLLSHLRERTKLYDLLFGRGHSRVSSSLSLSVRRQCESMGLHDRTIAISIGAPANFLTVTGDIRSKLFDGLTTTAELGQHHDDVKLVVMNVPSLEGDGAFWQPIVLGHEIAHYLQGHVPLPREVGVNSKIDRPRVGQLQSGPFANNSLKLRLFQKIAGNWLQEILCDAYAIIQFGAAGAAALSEFLDAVTGPGSASETHPPASLRVRLMLHWLGDEPSPIEEEILSAIRDHRRDDPADDWATYLIEVVEDLKDTIWEIIREWVGQDPYSARGRDEVIEQVANYLDQGLPGNSDLGTVGCNLDRADLVAGCWLAAARGSQRPVERLTRKGLEDLAFVELWTEAGGELADPVANAATATCGTLTAEDIRRRLGTNDSSRIVITPRVADPIGSASVDVRLGCRFILFERSSLGAFDPLGDGEDPRQMQSEVELSWGESFYLHPGQLVLAQTLEYFSLPADLTASVVTRSSYGRLGLITATAVQVHPLYMGCLTLELVNLGTMPIAVAPGERVAQLVFTTTSEPLSRDEDTAPKYRYPTHPEFSKVRSDSEREILRTLQRNSD